MAQEDRVARRGHVAEAYDGAVTLGSAVPGTGAEALKLVGDRHELDHLGRRVHSLEGAELGWSLAAARQLAAEPVARGRHGMAYPVRREGDFFAQGKRR